MGRFFGIVTLLAVAPLAASAQPPLPFTALGPEIFEKRIRPLFAEHCYQCHGPKKQESGLLLSSVAGIRKGGDRGPPIAPGDPDASLLIQAVRYNGDDLKMPPRGRLKDDQIADLLAWVKLGAPLPQQESAGPVLVRPSSDFNLAERRRHWAYQPLVSAAAPSVEDSAWCASPIDPFILSRLEASGLAPAAPAEKQALIRRVTFDLTGLPPTPQEVNDFLSDRSPDAYERLVDRLLASPCYGERFGRHWLDVVRYSETLGFEFDYDLHNAWRYRDYVIRAFNTDLPYNVFVIEHLAGDLLAPPRRHPIDGSNESILATGFFWMHEGKQTPVDIRQDQADRIDNQLDVLGKAFLGQTIACARCHDHKFDAISTRDYYALAGYLKSSRFQQAFIDPPDRLDPLLAELADQRDQFQATAYDAIGNSWLMRISQAARYLAAAASALGKDDAAVDAFARENQLDAPRLRLWIKATADDSLLANDHPLFAWAQRKGDLPPRRETETPAEANLVHFDADFAGWSATGAAFGTAPAIPAQIVVGSSTVRPIARLTSGGADSGLLSIRLQGELRSPTFMIDKKFVHLRVAGRNARVNLVIDGYTLIMNPMYGNLTVAPASDRLVWRSIPVDRWLGHRAFLEVSDSTIPLHGLNPPPSTARVPENPDGYITLREVVLSDDPNPPAKPSVISEAAIRQAPRSDASALATVYQGLMTESIERWRTGKWQSPRERDDDLVLLNWLLENSLLDDDAAATDRADFVADSCTAQISRYRELESKLPKPQRAPAIADGTGEDEFVFLRGNYRTPGERAPRDLPEVLRTVAQIAAPAGSGRLDLARRLVDPSNPLPARVVVNRLWQHHFGEGIVRTPDDFGRMGQLPSHPELLDHLAAELMRADWSMKSITRRMVSSSAYRMSSHIQRQVQSAEPSAPHLIDPENRLLHRMPIRRLEAEAIRDALLAASGRLSQQMHGPSVLPFLTPHMEGRGKPTSGPLDGEGRRSIYLNARRNFLTPLLLAFDYPVTFTPIGRRGTSTIAAQALTLMNDPFVVGQAQRWAERSLAVGGTTVERIENLYQTAFARSPTPDEVASAIDFLQQQSLRYGDGSDDPRVWADLCHVLINVKEFIFID